MLKKFNMQDCNSVSTPMDLGKNLETTTDEENKSKEEKIPYQEAIGSLLYLVQTTRPDIAYATNVLSRYCNNYTINHWKSVKRIFRYLKGTDELKLTYRMNGNEEVIGYCDADWAGNEERTSTSGYVFILQDGAISWSSKKQKTVALSTTEAEYMSLSAACQEAIWLKQLIAEVEDKEESIQIYCDNKSTIDLANTSSYKQRTKHIDIRHHFIKEKVESEEIKVKYMKTEEMVADSLTKAVHKIKNNYCAISMGLKI